MAVGAVRHCIFFDGAVLRNPLKLWERARGFMKFGWPWTENPAPLNELSPYGNISAGAFARVLCIQARAVSC